MNINLDDAVKICVKEGAGIERINIRYIRSNIPSKTHHSDQLHKHKHRSKNNEPIREQLQEASKSGGNESSYTCQISPSSGCSNRPKESYFFGQNPLPKYEIYEEEKESALYKVRKNEVLSHPDIPNEKPINLSVQKCIDSEGQHFSAVTFSDEHLDDKLENDMGIIIL